MAFFEGIKMTGGYGSGPDIISSCSVNVNKGEIVSILGPNGAGKSTAMKAMLGLLKLKSGKVVIDELFDHILKVTKTNVAILMVEQNAKQALSISDRGYVLVTGENRYSGTGKELLNDPRVRSSFLGG